MYRPVLTTVLVVLLLGAVVVSGTLTSNTLERLFVVHRHGARTPLVWANETVLCGPAGCGQLTPEGKDMLYHLGRYINENYNDTAAARSGNDNVFRLPPEYTTKRIVTTSTNYPRTVQSAAGMLCGLFNCPTSNDGSTTNHSFSVPDFLPYIETVPKDREVMLRPDKGWPTLVLHNAANEDPLWSMMNEVTLSMINATDLYRLGAEIGLGPECGVDPATGAPTKMNEMQPYVCALDAEDFWECTYSYANGKEILAEKYPFLAAKGELLADILYQSNFYQWYGFDRHHYPKYHKEIGKYGYYLAKDIIYRASANMTSTPGAPSSDYGEGPDAEAARLIQYSGHDVTLMTLQDSLGNQTCLHPVFGNAMIFEVHKQYGTRYIRAKMGQPGLTAEDHSYSFEWFELRCIDAAGNEYTATSEGCPLDDFDRFISNGAPASPLGVCAALPEDLTTEHCLPNSTGKPKHSCVAFRSGCPETSCGDNHFLKKDIATGALSCVAMDTSANKSTTGNSADNNTHHEHHHQHQRRIIIGTSVVGGLLALLVLVLGVKLHAANARLAAFHDGDNNVGDGDLGKPLHLQRD